MAGDTRRDGSGSGEPSPARGYKWLDFEPGNLAAVRHGAGSDRIIDERAQAVLDELAGSYPWLLEADAIIVDVLCRSIARLHALDQYITGVIDGSVASYPTKDRPTRGVEGVPQRIWEQVSRESRTVVDTAARLGLAPTDRAQLLKDTGMARHFGGHRIASLVEQGRRIAAGGRDE